MTGKLTIEYHAGNPNLCRIPELTIRSMPECEGGGWYMPREQAEMLVRAALASEPVAGTDAPWPKEEIEPGRFVDVDPAVLGRDAIARIIDPTAFNERYVEDYPDRSTIEQFTAYQKADATLALSAQPAPVVLRENIVRIIKDYISQADGEMKIVLQMVLHDVDDALSTLPPQADRTTASAPEPVEWHWRAIDDSPTQWFVVDGPIEEFKRDMEPGKYEIRPLYATPAPGAADRAEWQPIETAPRDGTPMLFCHWENPEQDVLPIMSGFWSRLSEGWYAELSGQKMRPTHWRPLPTPPTLPRADRGTGA